jgi:cell division septal protein FtsQ
VARQRGARGPRVHIIWSILLTVAVLAIPGAVVAWGRSTATFTTERVVVTGAHMIAKKEARRALEKALIGENLFAVGADDARRALRTQCYLADVEIDRDFPDTLRVRLVEHRPALAVLADGRWFLVSTTGHVICEAPPKGAAGGGPAAAGGGGSSAVADGADPAVEEGEGDDAAAGEGGQGPGAAGSPGTGTLEAGPAGKVEAALPRLRTAEAPNLGARAGDPKIRTAVEVLDGLPRGLRRRVAVLQVTKTLRVTVTLREGLVVRFGDASRLGDKAIVVRAVSAAYRTQGRTPTYIDVSVPERPLGRPLLK